MSLVPARCPGWLLERRVNPSPRGMAAQSRFLKRDRQNPAYRPSGIFLESLARNRGVGTLNGEKLCLGRNDRTTGDSPAGAPTETRAAPRRKCVCATARAAERSGIARRPRRRTAASAGISARRTPPNTTRTGIISLVSVRRKLLAALRKRSGAIPDSASRRNGNGPGRAMARVAATRCAPFPC